ncbi:unnamed protein product [Paramecium sonneborni]|uniref:Transmembrane protein n=1 Tax=Paramecium sonneborni TaxID=65129 RepID=A0A8S1RNH8_9CILI|nr:unnamed protein product [Paramecium sonneborni]
MNQNFTKICTENLEDQIVRFQFKISSNLHATQLSYYKHPENKFMLLVALIIIGKEAVRQAQTRKENTPQVLIISLILFEIQFISLFCFLQYFY